jgi:hypothetical protein
MRIASKRDDVLFLRTKLAEVAASRIVYYAPESPVYQPASPVREEEECQQQQRLVD